MIKNIGNFKDKIDGTIKCVYEMEKKNSRNECAL